MGRQRGEIRELFLFHRALLLAGANLGGFGADVGEGEFGGVKQMNAAAHDAAHADQAEEQAEDDDDDHEGLIAELSGHGTEERDKAGRGEGAKGEVNPAEGGEEEDACFSTRLTWKRRSASRTMAEFSEAV